MTNEKLEGHLKQLELLIKNNYTNLDIKISDLKKDIREDVFELKELNKILQQRQQTDHDGLIKTEQNLVNIQKDLQEFKDKEKDIGKDTDIKIQSVAKKIDKINISTGKVIGIAAGAGLMTGIVITIILFVIKLIGG